MKKLKKIELATCDVEEMNQQELINTEGGWVSNAWGYWDWIWGGAPYSYVAVFAPGLAGTLRGLYELCN